MAVSQFRSKRKPSGGRYKSAKQKKRHYLASLPALTKMGKDHAKMLRVRGGNTKRIMLTASTVNLLDPATKKFAKATIKTVVDNPANRHFIRRNIITKGTIVETDKGHARITSRPAQHGILNAVLIKK